MTLGYVTDRLAWDAAYTMTTTAARDRATVRGAIAIRNTTGVAFRARTRIVDAELGAWRDRTAEQLRAALHGAPAAAAGALPHDLGTVALGDGETRIELIGADAPRRLRSVLVYDPIGPGLDHTGAVPVADPSIGAAPPAPSQVRESFEIARDPGASRGLPAGPARLLERAARRRAGAARRGPAVRRATRRRRRRHHRDRHRARRHRPPRAQRAGPDTTCAGSARSS